MQKNSRIDAALKNFETAFQTLKRFLSIPIKDDRDRAGIIQAFEYSYELSWQCLKKIAEERGLEAPTPLQAFQAGFQMKLINEGEQDIWLKMKKTRNLTSHTYKEELADQVLQEIIGQYIQVFETLLTRIKSQM
jgi:nucleotidyltransferase substrate binding protein (TIGR01987 family)